MGREQEVTQTVRETPMAMPGLCQALPASRIPLPELLGGRALQAVLCWQLLLLGEGL